MYKKAKKLIEKYDTIILHRHNHPDGDAIGSQVGLKHILLANYPDKTVYQVGDAAGRYSFVEDSTMDIIDDSVYTNALAIILDCGGGHMVSDDRYKLAAATLRFDHHQHVDNFCQLEIVDTSRESCCGLLTDFAIACKYSIPTIAATALYTGMVTDSGRFRYDATNSQTMRMAATLLDCGIDTNELYRNLYSDDLDAIKLRASYILKINFTANNVAYIYTTYQQLLDSGADEFTISRGMVGTMGDIKGVDVWVNFTENGDKVLCELRSSKYNINSIAVKYGGGGHLKASGASVANKQEAMAMLADLDKLVENNE